MTATARGPGRASSIMQVHLSRDESDLWRAPDAAQFQDELVASFRAAATVRGRRYVRVFAQDGAQLFFGGVVQS